MLADGITILAFKALRSERLQGVFVLIVRILFGPNAMMMLVWFTRYFHG